MKWVLLIFLAGVGGYYLPIESDARCIAAGVLMGMMAYLPALLIGRKGK